MKMCINSIIYSIPLDYKTIRPGAPKSKQWLLLYGNFHLPFRPPTNPIPTQDTREDKQNIQNVCRYSNEANAHNNGVEWPGSLFILHTIGFEGTMESFSARLDYLLLPDMGKRKHSHSALSLVLCRADGPKEKS